MTGTTTIVLSVFGSFATLACTLPLSYAHWGWQTLPEGLGSLARQSSR